MSALIVLLLVAALIIIAIALIWLSIVTLPSYTGAVISRVGKPIRVIGSGWSMAWVFLLETVERVVSLQKRIILFGGEFKTANNEPIKLTIVYEWEPIFQKLIQFIAFKEEALQNLLTERIRATLTVIVRGMPDRRTVLDSFAEISNTAHKKIRDAMIDGQDLFESYYAITLRAVTISDHKLPEGIQDAVIRREAMSEMVRTRRIEIASIDEFAKNLVKSIKDQGYEVDFGETLNFIQRQFSAGLNGTNDAKAISVKMDKSTAEALAGFINAKKAT